MVCSLGSFHAVFVGRFKRAGRDNIVSGIVGDVGAVVGCGCSVFVSGAIAGCGIMFCVCCVGCLVKSLDSVFEMFGRGLFNM